MSAERLAAETRDVVIVGGGHNGLVAAFYLAKAGFKPLVLERRAQVGGAAITEEFHPGFRCSTLAHNTGPLRADIVRDMQLEQHGLKLTTPDVNTVSLLPDGRALVLYSDAKKTAQEIAQWSQKDAASYADFGTALGKIGKVIGEALVLTPPNIDSPSKMGMILNGSGRDRSGSHRNGTPRKMIVFAKTKNRASSTGHGISMGRHPPKGLTLCSL